MQWSEVVANRDLQHLPFKIELNQFGNIEMSPASVPHAYAQADITLILGRLRNGRVLTEAPIQTMLGVRVPDVAWASAAFMKAHVGESPFSAAPEICVEVLSESNSPAEMGAKTAAYLSAGAKEVWLVQTNKRIDVHTLEGKQAKSAWFRRMPVLR
jgi:Uma2 family endonuclease